MKTILFVCVHNAGRSQMAAAFLNRMAQERGLDMRADSAGTVPAGSVHPEVITAMLEAGIDISREKPKLLTNHMVSTADLVITMGCAPDAGTCRAILFRHAEDWGLEDPRGQPPDNVKAIRDEIKARVLALLAQETPPS